MTDKHHERPFLKTFDAKADPSGMAETARTASGPPGASATAVIGRDEA